VTNKIIKKIIIINFCLAAILAMVAGSMAAYTSLSSAKRVVSTTATKQMFSSDVLYTYNEEAGSPSTRMMSFSADSDSNTFQFTICNYVQGDEQAYSTKNIAYTLTVDLLDSKGKVVEDTDVLEKYQLDGKAFSSDEIEKVLLGSKASEDTYTISVPTELMSEYKIRIIAKSNVSNYLPIGRIISTAKTSVSVHWSGTFTDSIVGDTAHSPSELGSINVRISGQENEIMVISWDTDYVQIDPLFLENLDDDFIIEKDDSMIKFEVGSIGQPSQYYISFYRTKPAKAISNETWDDIKNYISFRYESITTNETTTETTAAGGDAND
jgi:hypothetical protein